jgi:putative transposase
MDLGLNNLGTVGSNVVKPFIINGKPLKSINQFYNKRVSNLKSKLTNGKKTSKRIKSLTDKRNNKIKDYLHKASTILVNQLVSNDLNTLIIGNNKGWKQDINIGKRNNQSFVQIPYSTFIKMIEYKCKLVGINVLITEESYTSKCSFLDSEDIKKQKEYKGKRIKRGLFKSSEGVLINADVNGSLNILRKVVGNFNYDPIEVCSTPAVITVKFN